MRSRSLWKIIDRKITECYKCGVVIFFDANIRGTRGKLVPLEKDTGLPHNCPGRKEADNNERF